jgi:hypothetical protein
MSEVQENIVGYFVIPVVKKRHEPAHLPQNEKSGGEGS